MIAGSYTGSSQHQPQCVPARGATDGIFRAAKAGDLALEGFDFFSKDVVLGSADTSHCSQHSARIYSNWR
ncbi:MAG: hypothetical protein WB562_18875 [Candidatus Sulfotelmatobacter sp.]